MKNKQSPRPPRKMKPFFIVFCEGETEEAYINFLRRKYRLPIKAVITGLSITPDKINRHLRTVKIVRDDKIKSYLFYDLDSKSIVAKIAACKASISNG